MRQKISDLERQLDPARFLRIHLFTGRAPGDGDLERFRLPAPK